MEEETRRIGPGHGTVGAMTDRSVTGSRELGSPGPSVWPGAECIVPAGGRIVGGSLRLPQEWLHSAVR
jgi:hypothetical protein